MTRKLFLGMTLVVLMFQAQAQSGINKIIKNTQKKTERNIENRINKRIDRGVDKTLDSLEVDIDDAVKKDKAATSDTLTPKPTSSEGAAQKTENDVAIPPSTLPNASASETAQPAAKLQWSKYDFVPGSEIIFEDNLENEQNGEFPSKWDLKSGSIENASLDGQNVIYFIKCNVNSGGGLVPLLTNADKDYLPEEFTIEFDAFFGEKSSSYVLYLADMKNQIKLDKAVNADDKWVRFHKNGGEYKQDISTKYYPGYSNAQVDKSEKWRHIAVSFHTRALKVYMDDARLLNIPNLGYNPTGITIGYHNPSGGTVGYIKNIRIAKGAVPLYDKFLTEGKFVTTGIKFDVNKSTIKPESMGTINYVVQMMKDHPELRFSVEGHTDSDGESASNQTLSEARAKAVMDQMVQLGINAGRLSCKGHGESLPMTGNETSEGKAQNRRVEFVKF